jgi:DNA-binding transcriptional ArsR family regulator
MDIFQKQAQVFKILMHPTRIAILVELRGGEQCVCHMEAMFGLRQAHISQHLMILRDAGLVTDRRDGWNIFYRVIKPEIYQVIDAMNGLMEAESSAQAGDIDSTAKSSAKKRTCPCPKCNAGAETTHHEMPELVLNRIETPA